MGIGFDVASLNQNVIEAVLSKPWAADGKNFSNRIWENKQKLIDTAHKELTHNMMLGQDPQKAIDAISKNMQVAKGQAGRLVMTEEAYFSSAAQKKAFSDLGVEKYEIVATLDSHTSEICRELDGKVFDMKDYRPGETAPPFHVWCRTTTAPYFEDDFGSIGERAAKDEEGKTYYVPGNMSYEEWKKKYVEGNKTELEYQSKSNIIELKRTSDEQRRELKFISDKDFDNLTIGAKKKGAVILRGTEEVEKHLSRQGASASCLGDVLMFRRDVCVSEILEEVHHFEQNLAGLNNDKSEPLRSVLNEIDAKQFLLDNAKKYKIPRNETEQTKRQLQSYIKRLKELSDE